MSRARPGRHGATIGAGEWPLTDGGSVRCNRDYKRYQNLMYISLVQKSQPVKRPYFRVSIADLLEKPEIILCRRIVVAHNAIERVIVAFGLVERVAGPGQGIDLDPASFTLWKPRYRFAQT